MISLIVPIRYRADLTRVCIDSVLTYTKDYELILVQEGEDEGITELLKSYNVKYAQNKEPKGFAGALNTGIELADKNTDYYCFLNNDTVATPNWMDNMLKAFDNPEVGLVSPTFTSTSSRQSVEWNDGRDFDYIYDSLKLMGVCFLIPKKAIDKVGKWDESFGLGGEEDYDMCIRISNAGYTLCIARKSFIYHYGGASFKELFKGDQDACMEHAKKQFLRLEDKHKIEIIPKNPDYNNLKKHIDNLVKKENKSTNISLKSKKIYKQMKTEPKKFNPQDLVSIGGDIECEELKELTDEEFELFTKEVLKR